MKRALTLILFFAGITGAAFAANEGKDVYPAATLSGHEALVEDVSLLVANTDAEWSRVTAMLFGKERANAEYMTYDVVGHPAREKARMMNVYDAMPSPLAIEDHTALFISAGAKGPGNLGVVVKSVLEKGEVLEVTWDVAEPEDTRKTLEKSSPFAVAFVPKWEKPVRFIGPDKVVATVGGAAGDEVVNGMQLALDVKPAEWKIGGTVEFACTMRPVTMKPWRVMRWGLGSGGCLEVADDVGVVTKPTFMRDASRKLADADCPWLRGKEKLYTLTGKILRNGKLLVNEPLGGEYTWDLETDAYYIRATSVVEQKNWTLDMEQMEMRWTGKLRSNAVKVQVPGRPTRVDLADDSNGLKLTLEAEPANWKPGDKIKLSCTAKNTSDKPIRVPAWGLDMFAPLVITDAAGKKLPAPSYGCKHCREYGAEDFPTLAPGETKTFSVNAQLDARGGKQFLTIYENRGGGFGYELKDGVYEVSALVENKDSKERAAFPRDAAQPVLWTGKAVSEPIKVTVGAAAQAAADPVDAAKMAKADIVVRAKCMLIPAAPGHKGGWPQWQLTISKVFKGADATIKPGANIVLIALDAPDGHEATFYVHKDDAYGAGYVRLMDNNRANDVSHESKATSAPVDAAGKPANGLKIAFEVTPTEWAPGDDVKLACTVTNVSDTLAGIPSWGLGGEKALELTDAEGKTLAHPECKWLRSRKVTPGDFPNLPAGESRKFVLTGRITDEKVLMLAEPTGGIWAWKLADGEYSVRAIFANARDQIWGVESFREAKPAKLWTGEALSLPVSVTVGKPAPTKVDLDEANGLKLALDVKPATWRPGEKVEFSCTATNDSDKDITLAAWGLDLGEAIIIRDAAGHEMKYGGGRDETAPLRGEDFPVVKAHESKTFVLTGGLGPDGDFAVGEIRGGVWDWKLAPGEYTVTAVLNRTGKEADEMPQLQKRRPLWTGKALSNSVKVTVGAKEERAWGEPVNGLALAVDVKPTELFPGAAVELTCFVKNVSDKGITVGAWGLDLDPAIEVTDSKGHVFPNDGGRNRSRMVRDDDYITIPAGGEHAFTLRGEVNATKVLVVHELLGGIWHWQFADGKYSLRAELLRTAQDAVGGKTGWTGQAFSKPVEVTMGDGPAKVDLAPAPALKLTLAVDKTELKMKPRQLRRATEDTPRYDTSKVKFTLTFTNVSDKPIKLDAYGLVWGRLKLAVTGPNPKSVVTHTYPADRKMAPPAEEDFPVLEPGKSRSYEIERKFPMEIGDVETALQEVADYKVKFVYSGPGVDGGKLAEGAWAGEVTSNEVTLKGIYAEDLAPAAADVNGLELAFDLKPAEWKPGTKIEFGFNFKNVSDKPMRVNARGRHIDVIDANGKVLVFGAVQEAMRKKDPADSPVVEPGKTVRLLLDGSIAEGEKNFTLNITEPSGVMLTWWLKPGEYTVRGVLDCGLANADEGDETWSGRLVSAPVKVTVTEPADGPAKVDLAPEAKPGDAVHGLKLTVSADKPFLKMTPREINRGAENMPRYDVECAKLTLTFTNTSDKPVKFDAYFFLISHLSYVIEGPPGRSVIVWPMAMEATPRLPNAEDFKNIEPGKSFTSVMAFPGNAGGKSYYLNAPGEYRVRAVYDHEAVPVDPNAKTFAEGSWAGHVESNELVFAGVVPGEPVGGLKMEISAQKTELPMTKINYARSTPDSPPYKVDAAEVKMSFTNVSDKPIKINKWDLATSGVWPDVVGPFEGSVRIFSHPVLYNHMAMPSANDYVTIQPGDTWTSKESYLFPTDQNAWAVQLKRPGEFRLALVYSRQPVPEEDPRIRKLAEGAWTGTLMSNELVFKAVEAAEDPKGKETVWSDVAKDGMQIGIRVPKRTVSSLGQIKAEITVKNAGKDPLAINTEDVAGYYYGLDVLDAEHKPVPKVPPPFPHPEPGDEGYDKWEMKHRVFDRTLKPGETWDFTRSPAIHLARPDGTYFVRFTHNGVATPELEVTLKAAEGPTKVDLDAGIKLTVSADRDFLTMFPRTLLRATKDAPRWDVSPARLTLTFTNTTDKPVTLDTYDLAWSRLSLEVTGPDGESVRVVERKALREMLPPHEKDYPKIEPGKSFEYSWKPYFPATTFGEKEYILLKPGEYRLKVTYRGPEQKPYADGKPMFGVGSWSGTATSNELVFSAIEPGQAVKGLKMTISAEKTDLAMTPIEYDRSTPDSPPYKVRPVEVKVSFTNVSDKPIKVGLFDIATTGIRPDVLDLAQDRARVYRQELRRDHDAVVSERDYPTLAPGETWTSKETYLFPTTMYQWVPQLRATGEFRVALVYEKPALDLAKNRFPFIVGAWCGVLASNEIAFTAAVAKPEESPVKANADPAPGSAVKGIKLTVTADRDTLPARLTFKLTNVSEEAIKLDLYDFVWGRLEVSIDGPNDHSVTKTLRPIERTMRAPIETDYKTLDPGQSWTCPQTVTLPGDVGAYHYDLTAPGEYRVRVAYAVGEPNTGGQRDTPLDEGKWRGTVVGNELKLTK